MVAESWLHQQIIEQMPLAVVVWRAETDDPRDLRLVYTSPRGTAETGADLAPFVGTRFFDSFPAAYETDVPHNYFAVATGSKPEYQEILRYGDETITESWFRIDARPVGPTLCPGDLYQYHPAPGVGHPARPPGQRHGGD